MMRGGLEGGRPAPPAGLITWQIIIGSLIACAPGAGAPLGPPRVGSDAEGEGQGVGMSGDARTLSPPHLASCGSLLWLRRRRRSGDRIPSPRTLRPAALIVVTVSDRGMAPDPADDLPPTLRKQRRAGSTWPALALHSSQVPCPYRRGSPGGAAIPAAAECPLARRSSPRSPVAYLALPRPQPCPWVARRDAHTPAQQVGRGPSDAHRRPVRRRGYPVGCPLEHALPGVPGSPCPMPRPEPRLARSGAQGGVSGVRVCGGDTASVRECARRAAPRG